MKLEEKLMAIDFSKFSKVKDSLLQEILQRRQSEIMDMEELDYVAAAGNPNVKKFDDKIKN
ncbi:MAG: hypothetical protein IJS29_02205 [Selenomonadaceae bacterium]|nr:hypothetical protein [Selenomonadaceae bacterium]